MEETIGAAKFKEQCLAILERLPPEGIIITKHGKRLARLVPYREASEDLIGCLRGKIKVKGDLLTTGTAWDAAAHRAND